MITSFVNIKIKRDNYAYLTVKGDNSLHNAKLFELLQESFKREIKSYNPVTRYYNVRTKSFFKLMMEDGKKKNNRAYDMIRVKAGLIPYLCKSLEDRNISYSLDETDRQKLTIFDEDDKLVFKLNDKVELRDYQKEAVKAVFEKGYCGIQLVTGSGKEQPITAKVLTPTGFRYIGDLLIGDDIIAGDGKVTKVIGKYPQGVKDVYRITFSDNTTAECGLNHIWTVSSIKNKKSSKFFDITLKDILKEQQLDLEYGGRARNWRYEIPLATVEGENKQFIIQPYTLGVLIADGCMCGKEVGFSCNDYDYDIRDRVLAELDPEMRLSGGKHYNHQSCPQYKIVHKSIHICYNKFRQEIIRLGLNVKSKDKFIPKEYLYGTSINQRKALLQGLFDCNGTQAKNKASAGYCTTSLQLAKDVIELIQSLGFTATLNVMDRTKENKSTEYYVCLSSKDYCPFSLTRKAQYWRQSSDKTRRYIRKIELVRQEESVCIEVESKTKQYLTDNYIVTHNTEVTSSIIRTYFNNCTDKNKAVLYVVPTLKLQLESEERFNQYDILDCNKQLPLVAGKVNIITYMSLVRCEVENPEIVGCLIFDEAQHLKGDKARDIIHKFNNLDMCVGLSATLTKDIENKKYLKNLDETDLNVLGSLGDIAYFKPIKDTIDDKFVTPVKVYVVDNPEKVKLKINDWLLVKNHVLKSQYRAEFVAEFINHTMKVGNFNTLCVLIPEIEWSRQYMLEVAKVCKDARIILTYGGERYEEIIDGELRSLSPEEKQEAEAAIRNPNIKTIFSCTTYFFEGVNIPCIQGVVNCYGGRSTVKVKQQLGRAMRLFKGKDVAYIFEIHDDNPVMESQLKYRLTIYKNEYGAKIIKSKFRS